jgi:flagellar biosynthetic protein FliR
MPNDVILATSTLLGFLLTLARISGVFVFVPLPGLHSGFDLARVMLSLSLTVALFPYWPRVQPDIAAGFLAVWIISEAAFGIGIGLSVAFITEGFNMAAQIIGLQAGYGYASTVDPTSQVDSTILVIFAQLAAGLLFFATGLDREVIRIFAGTLQATPAVLSQNAGRQLLSLGGLMFSTGLRLALPVVAVLLMVDISLALLGRVNAQLQLLTIAFPIKMLVGLAIFAWLLLLIPIFLRSGSESAFTAGKALLVR